MPVQTDLNTAIDAYIQANFIGSLAEISALKLPLERLLDIQRSLTTQVAPAVNTVFTTGGVGYESPPIQIVRPANTTPYVANSVIGNSTSAIITFPSMGVVGKDTYITDCRLTIQTATIPAGMTSFRLHLYNASPVAIADRATWDYADLDIPRYLGYADIGSILDFGTNLWLQSDSINIKRRCLSTSFFGLLVTNGAFTPTSGLIFNIILGGISA